MSDVKTVTLKKPLQTGDGELKVLEFKNELNAGNIAKRGFPFVMDGAAGTQEMKADAILGYLSDMTGVHEPILKKMGPADFMECAGVVMGFFGETGEG